MKGNFPVNLVVRRKACYYEVFTQRFQLVLLPVLAAAQSLLSKCASAFTILLPQNREIPVTTKSEVVVQVLIWSELKFRQNFSHSSVRHIVVWALSNVHT